MDRGHRLDSKTNKYRHPLLPIDNSIAACDRGMGIWTVTLKPPLLLLVRLLTIDG